MRFPARPELLVASAQKLPVQQVPQAVSELRFQVQPVPQEASAPHFQVRTVPPEVSARQRQVPQTVSALRAVSVLPQPAEPGQPRPARMEPLALQAASVRQGAQVWQHSARTEPLAAEELPGLPAPRERRVASAPREPSE